MAEIQFGQSDLLVKNSLAGETVWPVLLWLVTLWPETLWPVFLASFGVPKVNVSRMSPKLVRT